MNQIEKLNAISSGDAAISKSAQVNEQANAKGTYKLNCISPVEHLRGRYVQLRDSLAEFDKKHWLVKLIFSKKIKSLTKEFIAIPTVLKFSEPFPNIVTTAGKNNALDSFLAGSAYTAAWYLGLISITSYVSAPVIGDTAASHTGWTEDQNYSQSTRPTAAWSSASSGSKSLSAALSFSINASTTIKGCFLISNSTKGGTTGVLYSAGLFTGGDKVVANGDTLNVSYSASL